MSHWDVCVVLALKSANLDHHQLIAICHIRRGDVELVESGRNQPGETRLSDGATELDRCWRDQNGWLANKLRRRAGWIRGAKSGTEQRDDLTGTGWPAGYSRDQPQQRHRGAGRGASRSVVF